MRATILGACSLVVLLCSSSNLVAASPEDKTIPAKVDASRAPDELREAIRAAMKRTNSMAERSVADRLDQPAIVELVDLYRALENDTQLPVAERDSLSSQVRIRLQRIGKTIDRKLQRTARASMAKAKTAPSKTAQSNATPSTTAQSNSAPASPAPTSVAAAGGGPVDHGQELLNLIKATIATTTWDDQGGNGTIFYWPAWHVLVIRQTDEVHEQIEGLLKALR